MKASTVCLIAAVVCFTVGAVIFMLALFLRMFDPEVAGGIGSVLIIAFLLLSVANIILRNREMAKEKE